MYSHELSQLILAAEGQDMEPTLTYILTFVIMFVIIMLKWNNVSIKHHTISDLDKMSSINIAASWCLCSDLIISSNLHIKCWPQPPPVLKKASTSLSGCWQEKPRYN